MKARTKIALSVIFASATSVLLAEKPVRWIFSLKSGQAEKAGGVGTLTDGNWVLNATIKDASLRQLWIGDGLWDGENKQTNGNAFTGVGHGTLDLTGRVASTDGQETKDWTIVRLAAMAFTGPNATLCPEENNGTNEYPRSVVMPTTLTAWQYKGFRWNGSSQWVTNLVMHCPDLTGDIGPDTLTGHNKGDWRWVLDVPKVTTIGAIGSFCIGASTDFDEWHLESVTTFGGEYTFSGAAGKGTLRLPSMSVVPEGRFPAMNNITGFELGATNPVTTIARSTFQCASLRRLALTVGPSGLDVAEAAFTRWPTGGSESTQYRATRIRALEFPWYVASTTAVSRILNFIPALASQGNDPCVVYASEAFGANNLVSRQPTGSETPPVLAEGERVLGIFADDAGTDKAWVVHRVSAKRYACQLTVDTRWPEDGVTVEPALEAGNLLVAGETYQFQAKPGTNATFARWEGVTGAAATNPVLTVRADGDVTVKPVFHHDWTFDFLRDGQGVALSDRYGQIDNGVWKLNVELYAPGELCCGTNRGNMWSGPQGTAWTGVGSGALDLNGTIRQLVPGAGDAVTTNVLLLTRVGSKAFKKADGLPDSAFANSLTLPPSIRYWEVNPVREAPITELIVDCPELQDDIAADDLAGLKLTHAVFNLPKTKTVSWQASFRVYAETDLSTWNLDSVTAFGYNLINESTCHGTLRLPSVTELMHDPYGKDLGTFWRIEGATTDYGAAHADKMVFVELGSKRRSFTGIGPDCFVGCPGIRGITIFTRLTDLPVDATAFLNDSSRRSTSNIRMLAFPLRVPGSAAVTKMLSQVPSLASQGADPCIVYGASGYGASALASPATAADGTPPAVGEGESVLGVFVDANGVRKAWVIHRQSLLQGFVLTVR